jgi:very-short-patch-repair endonuclease
MTKNRIKNYNPKLKERARQLRKNSTFAEVLLWQQIKRKSLGYEFHRQVPIGEFIVDFYCHELSLAIEIDGATHDDKYIYDKIRQEYLEKKQVRIIRFTDTDIKNNMEAVLIELTARINQLR